MRLTERGRLLVAEGGPLLRELERVTTLVESPVLAKRKLRVIAFSTAMRGLVAPALARYQSSGDRHAPLETQLRSVEPEAAVQQVARGDADLAVVHNWSSIPLAIPAGVRARPRIRRGRRGAPGEPPAGVPPAVDRSELLDEPWASTPAGAICHEALMRLFADLGVVPRWWPRTRSSPRSCRWPPPAWRLHWSPGLAAARWMPRWWPARCVMCRNDASSR